MDLPACLAGRDRGGRVWTGVGTSFIWLGTLGAWPSAGQRTGAPKKGRGPPSDPLSRQAQPGCPGIQGGKGDHAGLS
jgi:hypothetical protein